MKFKTNSKQNGFIVIVVLCTIALLMVLLLIFNRKSRAHLYSVDSFRKSEQALNCARAGLNIAIAAIKETSDIHKNTNLANLLSGQNTIPVGDGNCTVTVTEENGKLNINMLIDETGKPNRIMIDQLFRLIDLLNNNNHRISYSLVPSIIDWTDSDNQVTSLSFVKYENLGAESDYYSNLEPPYKCKNRLLDTIEELLIIKGVTPGTFECIQAYVTVKGDGKVNINCAPKLVIESLSEKIDPALAQIIIDRRKFKPLESLAELKDIPGMTDNIYHSISKNVTVNPSQRYHYVTSLGNVEHQQRTIVAIIKKIATDKNVEIISCKEF